ncbi:MAG: hypothetical protein PHQ18_01225 [Patescibacteria group bacterium]|nr:hypothetical protein [Patescibacteria group bacterium]
MSNTKDKKWEQKTNFSSKPPTITEALALLMVNHLDNLLDEHSEEIKKEGEKISYKRLKEIILND